MYCFQSDGIDRRVASPSWHSLSLLLVACATPAGAQSSPAASSLETRITEAAQTLGQDRRFAEIAPPGNLGLVEFVGGNVLFALAHEMGHVAMTELGLTVLGREEDAADGFATLLGLKMGNAFALGVLENTAAGWFLSDQRNRSNGIHLAFFDQHGLDQQRAYNIVCLMVGSDIEKFRSLANRVGMPEARQQSCAGDYSNASWSWNKALEPHRRGPETPQTKINIIYEPGGPNAELEAVFRHLRMLESVADYASSQFAWRAELSLEMQTCGSPDAGWYPEIRKVIVCYELAADFAQLYLEYGDKQRPPPPFAWKRLN